MRRTHTSRPLPSQHTRRFIRGWEHRVFGDPNPVFVENYDNPFPLLNLAHSEWFWKRPHVFGYTHTAEVDATVWDEWNSTLTLLDPDMKPRRESRTVRVRRLTWDSFQIITSPCPISIVDDGLVAGYRLVLPPVDGYVEPYGDKQFPEIVRCFAGDTIEFTFSEDHR